MQTLSQSRAQQLSLFMKNTISNEEVEMAFRDPRGHWAELDKKRIPKLHRMAVQCNIEMDFLQHFRALINDHHKYYSEELTRWMAKNGKRPENPLQLSDLRTYSGGSVVPPNWGNMSELSRMQYLEAYLNDWCKTRDDISKLADAYGLQLDTASTDGSCFFDSLRQTLPYCTRLNAGTFAQNMTSLEIRQSLVTHVRHHWTIYCAFLPGKNSRSFKTDYLKSMSNPITWADSVMVSAAAEYFGIGIIVWTLNGQPMEQWPCDSTQDEDTVILFNPLDNHYEPLVPRNARRHIPRV